MNEKVFEMNHLDKRMVVAVKKNNLWNVDSKFDRPFVFCIFDDKI